MKEVVIAGAARTPVGAFNGGLSGVAASYLGSVVIKEALRRAKTNSTDVDEVLIGQILTAGTGQNPARQAAVDAEALEVVPPCPQRAGPTPSGVRTDNTQHTSCMRKMNAAGCCASEV